MASDIAVGIVVLAAAKTDDLVKREEQARQREEERRLRELVLRRDHVAERRLGSREAALSADGLEQRFEKNKLFGDDDDHAFRQPYCYY